jgi:hypothetical protein
MMLFNANLSWMAPLTFLPKCDLIHSIVKSIDRDLVKGFIRVTKSEEIS